MRQGLSKTPLTMDESEESAPIPKASVGSAFVVAGILPQHAECLAEVLNESARVAAYPRMLNRNLSSYS
jgi:hypothetical protein